ncbi:MAG: DUF1178 family protein [Hydrogenophilaceae bacterium]|jgi:hypothetical protein|nr:DUF1178 family protein [Hydrogenophilaceae bacterium]
MIRYDLRCAEGDEFEAWFAAIADFDRQAAAKLIECPHCGSRDIEKAPMAPAIVRGRKEADEARKIAVAMAQEVRRHIRDNYDYVGDAFPAEARKMHEGETEHRPIWGEATPEEARRMAEEGLPVAPLPPALAPTPPKKVN